MMLEVALDSDGEWDSNSVGDALVRGAAEAAIAESAFPQLGRTARLVELSVRLTGDDDVRALNAKWRGKDQATNVLSFPLAGKDELDEASEGGPELMLGDIVLAAGICAAEAKAKAISVADHAAHLIVHGTLHLLGYDHHGDADSAMMEACEVRALARLGIADPYMDTR
ncbi:MAG: rRNA maturation RNase YbeY [Sphingomicrobium sp.]